MTRARLIDDDERRARLVTRHFVGSPAPDVERAVRAVVALHSSDPITPYLAMRARVPGFVREDLETELFEHKSLWRLHAMRRTLFVVPSDEGSLFRVATQDVADKERRRVEGWVAAVRPKGSAAKWMAGLEAEVVALLSDGVPRRTQELSQEIPALTTTLQLGSGKWVTDAPLSSRLLFLLAMEGRLVRTESTGSWRSSQYRWAATDTFFGAPLPELTLADARAQVLRRYLARHGPATLVDLRWWTGWTKKAVGAALTAIDAATVALEGGREGWLLPDDLAPVEMPRGAAHALLPGLDPTPMGWKERAFYLGPHAAPLFDRNGNIGPTIWRRGRIVGGWGVREAGEVAHRLLEDIGVRAERGITRHAAELGAWLEGTQVTPRFRTPLDKELATATGTRA